VSESKGEAIGHAKAEEAEEEEEDADSVRAASYNSAPADLSPRSPMGGDLGPAALLTLDPPRGNTATAKRYEPPTPPPMGLLPAVGSSPAGGGGKPPLDPHRPPLDLPPRSPGTEFRLAPPEAGGFRGGSPPGPGKQLTPVPLAVCVHI
jgi:hypothetical protein